MAQRKKGKGKATKIHIEFHLRIRQPQRATLTAQAIRDMVVYWVEMGEQPSGVEVLAVSWERNGRTKRAEEDELEAVRLNMLRRFIHSLPLTVTVEP